MHTADIFLTGIRFSSAGNERQLALCAVTPSPMKYTAHDRSVFPTGRAITAEQAAGNNNNNKNK